jgi:hypothetical protein
VVRLAEWGDRKANDFFITENRVKPAYNITARNRNFSVAGRFLLMQVF